MEHECRACRSEGGKATAKTNGDNHCAMPQADGMILAKEEESDAEVRREDQDRINEFGELNARLYEVRSEVKKLKVSEFVEI
jgi:hypothetical protein